MTSYSPVATRPRAPWTGLHATTFHGWGYVVGDAAQAPTAAGAVV